MFSQHKMQRYLATTTFLEKKEMDDGSLKIYFIHSYFQEYHLDYDHKCISSLQFFAQVQYLIIVTVLVSIYTLVLMSIDRWGH